MYRSLLMAFTLMLFLNQPVRAAEDNGIIDEHNKDSSSFVVEPDPLDPLPVKKENIKDGDEIILDDIRQVINRKKTPSGTAGNGVPATDDNSGSSSSVVTKKSRVSKSSRKSKKSKKTSQQAYENLNPDDPDTKLENRLHSVYQKFNLEPTSAEEWGKVATGQKDNIYVVQKKDTLFTISKTLFGDSKFWPKIWALNRGDILNPHQILPGMKIHFFAGDADNMPTLSIGSKMTGDEEKDRYFVQDTEFQKINHSKVANVHKSHDPTAIPESFPLTRNGKYYSSADRQDKIDLKVFEYVEDYQHTNPFVLSSVDLKSDFVVEKDEIEYLLCKDNQFVPLVEKVNDVAAGKFLIITKLDRDKSRLRDTFKYKLIGDVTINDQNQMRVSSCKDLMDTSTLIVSEEKLKGLAEPDEAFKTAASIIDGLDYGGQQYYTDNQYLVISLEGLNVDTGANLNVFSDSLGKRVGQLKVLRRSGTVGIAVITNTYDIISVGDRLTE